MLTADADYLFDGRSMTAHVFDRRCYALCSLLVKGEHPDAPPGTVERDREIVRLYSPPESWTQRAIAEKFGLTPARISQIIAESGADTRRVPVATMMGNLLGVTPDTVSAWRTGRRKIPGYAWRTLNALSAVAELAGVDAVRWAVMDPGKLEEHEGGSNRVIDYEIPEHRRIAGLRV